MDGVSSLAGRIDSPDCKTGRKSAITLDLPRTGRIMISYMSPRPIVKTVSYLPGATKLVILRLPRDVCDKSALCCNEEQGLLLSASTGCLQSFNWPRSRFVNPLEYKLSEGNI